MKKVVLKMCVLALIAAVPGVALATVNMDTNTGAKTYAKELITVNTTVLNDSVAGTELDVAHGLGFGVSINQLRYVRYDLTNAKFATALVGDTAAPGDGDLLVDNLIPAAPADVALVSGGTANSAFVIFQITANTNYSPTATVDFYPGDNGIKIVDKEASASIKYSLYETAADAVLGGASGLLASDNEVMANITSGVTFTTVTNKNIADVTNLYKKFLATGADAAETPLLANIGNVTFAAVAGVLNPTASAPLALADLVGGGTKLVLTGVDLSAAAVLRLSDTTDCAGIVTPIVGSGLTATTANFQLGAAPILPLVNRAVCFSANNTTPIKDQTFTIAADVVPAAATDTADKAATTLGTFEHDGTVLKAPVMAQIAGQSNYIQLSNMGINAAPYTVRCFAPSGAVTTGTAGTVTAGNTAKLYMSGLGCGAGSNSVEFTLAVPTGEVVGALVRQNTTTGDSAMDSLTGNR